MKKHFVLAGNAEHTFERNDNEDLATVIQARNGRIRSRVVHRELGERAVWVKALAVRHAELASGKLGVGGCQVLTALHRGETHGSGMHLADRVVLQLQHALVREAACPVELPQERSEIADGSVAASLHTFDDGVELGLTHAIQVEVVEKSSEELVGTRDRKREGGENGDRDRKGGDRAQQQVAGREGGQSSGRARGAAARRRRGQDDAATIAATTNNRGRKSVRERVASANGMTVSQAIQQSIYTTRTLKADEAAGYIQLVRAAEAGLAGFDEPNSVGSPMDEDNFAHNPIDDFSD